MKIIDKLPFEECRSTLLQRADLCRLPEWVVIYAALAQLAARSAVDGPDERDFIAVGEQEHDPALIFFNRLTGRLVISPGSRDTYRRFAAAAAFRYRGEAIAAVGPEPDIGAFADAWTAATGRKVSALGSRMLYWCTTPMTQSRVASGELAPARPSDMDFVMERMGNNDSWAIEQHASPQQRRLTVAQEVADGRVYLWRAPEPVALAALDRENELTAVLTQVWTPPARRRCGYASALVATLARLLILQREMASCHLFIDPALEHLHRFYTSIGFERASTWTVVAL